MLRICLIKDSFQFRPAALTFSLFIPAYKSVNGFRCGFRICNSKQMVSSSSSSDNGGCGRVKEQRQDGILEWPLKSNHGEKRLTRVEEELFFEQHAPVCKRRNIWNQNISGGSPIWMQTNTRGAFNYDWKRKTSGVQTQQQCGWQRSFLLRQTHSFPLHLLINELRKRADKTWSGNLLMYPIALMSLVGYSAFYWSKRLVTLHLCTLDYSRQSSNVDCRLSTMNYLLTAVIFRRIVSFATAY